MHHCCLHTGQLWKTRELWLSSWKLLGPIIMTDPPPLGRQRPGS
ncbi:rCG29018 [Rattus norvegicus]|uniref:RCG29018 n=1 Tax=Rattus norvegicus TaxID=10116 RepID=A6HWJ9_RAT|nr:rCG29018 [Rattus norvegicus]